MSFRICVVRHPSVLASMVATVDDLVPAASAAMEQGNLRDHLSKKDQVLLKYFQEVDWHSLVSCRIASCSQNLFCAGDPCRVDAAIVFCPSII